MGAKSTNYVNRYVALEIVRAKLEKCTDDVLCNILECFPESKDRNYLIAEPGVPKVIGVHTICCISDFNNFS